MARKGFFRQVGRTLVDYVGRGLLVATGAASILGLSGCKTMTPQQKQNWGILFGVLGAAAGVKATTPNQTALARGYEVLGAGIAANARSEEQAQAMEGAGREIGRGLRESGGDFVERIPRECFNAYLCDGWNDANNNGVVDFGELGESKKRFRLGEEIYLVCGLESGQILNGRVFATKVGENRSQEIILNSVNSRALSSGLVLARIGSGVFQSPGRYDFAVSVMNSRGKTMATPINGVWYTEN